MTKLLVSPTGEKHGLINSVGNSVKKEDGYKNMEPKWKEELDKRRKADAQLVKARYINHRGTNERLDKPYCRYAGDTIDSYHLIPGEIYDLPKGFIDEVNGSPGLARRSDLLDANGQLTLKDGKPEKLHELVPATF